MLVNVVVDGAGGIHLRLQPGGLGDLAGQVAVFLVQVGLALDLAEEAVRAVVAADHQLGHHAFGEDRLQGGDLALDQGDLGIIFLGGLDLHLLGQVEGAVIQQLQPGVAEAEAEKTGQVGMLVDQRLGQVLHDRLLHLFPIQGEVNAAG